MGEVVNLSDRRLSSLCDKISKTENKEEKKKVALEIFKEAERKNKEKKERLRKERAAANKKVLRSYRIKK